MHALTFKIVVITFIKNFILTDISSINPLKSKPHVFGS